MIEMNIGVNNWKTIGFIYHRISGKTPTGCALSEQSGQKQGISMATTVWCGKVGSNCNCDINPEISTNHSIGAVTSPSLLEGKHGVATSAPKSKDAHTRLAQLQGERTCTCIDHATRGELRCSRSNLDPLG
jgi:hypothetical protein